MQFLFDYFPIVVFFVAYKVWNIYVATALTMGASLLQVVTYRCIYKHYERSHLIALGFILLLGSSTLLLHDPIFIQWKPTIVYWVFSFILISSQFIGSQSLIQRLLHKKISLPRRIWTHLNASWAFFFLALGALNLYVVYHYDTDSWVNFKLFGTSGLLLLFTCLQSFYIVIAPRYYAEK